MSSTTSRSEHTHLSDGGVRIDVFFGECLHRQEWYKDGVLHNETGPAYIGYTHNVESKIHTKSWYKNGKLHNLNGPAYISFRPYSFEAYFINGIEYSEKDFQQYIKDINPKDLNLLSDLSQQF